MCLIVAVAAVVNQIRPVVQLLDHIRLSEPEFMSIYIYRERLFIYVINIYNPDRITATSWDPSGLKAGECGLLVS